MCLAYVEYSCRQAIKACKDLRQVISSGAFHTEKFLSAVGPGKATGASGRNSHTKMQRMEQVSKVLEYLLAAKQAERESFTLCQGTQLALQNALQVRHSSAFNHTQILVLLLLSRILSFLFCLTIEHGEFSGGGRPARRAAGSG
jgi:hypothetical protein